MKYPRTNQEIYHRHGHTPVTHDYHAIADMPASPSVYTTTPEQRRAATRHIASAAHNVTDCTELLAMLGLTAQEGK